MVGISLLGPVVVDGGGGALSPRERAVLSVLALRRGRAVRADQLAEALWGERPPATWPKQIQASIGLIRKALGAGAVETVPDGYRLTLADDEVDVARFERLVAAGRGFAAGGQPDRAAAAFERALALWRGPPFADLTRWSPAVSEAARLEETRRGAEEELLEARLACGEHREVAASAEVLVEAEPLRERRWALLALAQYRCGRQADALRSLRRARQTLVEQLGIEPGRQLQELEAAVLNQAADLEAPAFVPPASGDCPYPGLASYDTADHDRFFGRDEEVAACLDRLRASAFLVVTGASGSGKSSLVRAGVAAALAAAGRSVVVLVPGRDPLGALAAAPPPGPGTAVVVDQLEELYAAEVAPETARIFCERLSVHAAAGSAVVLAVRADHLIDLAADPSIGRAAEHLLFVVPLVGERLRAAIERPAAQAGLRVEPGLVDLLQRDVEGEPGALPLLSHALVETWRRRDGNVLTVDAYRASGGIRAAVAQSADRVYEALPAERRAVLRSLMLRLVTPTSEGAVMRCRLPATTVRSDPDLEQVVDLLVRERLVTAEADSVELAHESLARAWPRLRSWLEDDTDGQRILRHLATAAEGWDSLGRPDSELYRGPRLEATVEHVRSSGARLTPVEVAFLDAAEARATSELRALQEQAALDARRSRRLAAALAGVGVLLVVALLAGALAVNRSRDARRQRDAARAAESDAQRAALVSRSLALRATNRATAALLAVEAARRWPDDPGARSALLGSFTAAPDFLGYLHPTGETQLFGEPVPGTAQAVVVADDQAMSTVDLETGAVVAGFDTSSDPPSWTTSLDVSADGRFAARVLQSSEAPGCFELADLREGDGPGCTWLSVHDVATRRPVGTPVQLPFSQGHLALSDDGALVAVTGGYDGDLAVYRTSDGTLIGRLDGLGRAEERDPPWDAAAVGFGPDGLLYVGSLAGPVRVVDPDGARVLRTVELDPYLANQQLAVGSDGLVVVAGFEGLVGFDAASGAVRWQADLPGNDESPCPWFTVSEVLDRVYCGNHVGVVTELERSTGRLTGRTYSPQLGSVGTLGMARSGTELVAFGAQAPVISRWALRGDGLVTRSVAEGHVAQDGFDISDPRTLLVTARQPSDAGADAVDDLALWDVEADREEERVQMGTVGTEWAGLGTLVGYTPDQDRLEWYDTASRRPATTAKLPASCDRVFSAAGGRRAYCALEGGELWTIDPVRRERIEPTFELGGTVYSVSATRDGETVVTTTATPTGLVTAVHDGRTGALIVQKPLGLTISSVSLDGVLVGALGGALTRYDLRTLEPLAELPGARGGVNSLQFSDDGRTLLVGSGGPTAWLFDVPSGTPLGDPIAADAAAGFPAFLRPDGGALAVTVADGVALWDLDPEHLIEAACRLAGRNLTDTEWQTELSAFGERRPTCPAYA